MTPTRIPSLYELSLPQLKELIASWLQPAYRANQIFCHLYKHYATDVQAMTNLPAALREQLQKETRFHTLKLLSVQTGDHGATRKALFQQQQGKPVESVLMVYPDRATVCVSTQSGCPIRCAFCATGQLGLLANLTAGQIVEQVLWAARELRTFFANRALTNVVYMGMGEPFLNYDAWWESVQRLNDPQAFGLGARSFTVSTVGVIPGILRLAKEPLQVNLAVSLHAANDALRCQLVPLNRQYSLNELLVAVRQYTARTHRRVSFEYVLIHGVNDELRHARELADWCCGSPDHGKPLLCHVNLIPWNPVPTLPLLPAQKKRVLAFKHVLETARVPCTVRVQRGIEIGAACGQLAAQALHV